MYLPEPKHGEDWSRIIAILGHVVRNWTEFDGWALTYGFDPLEVPSRRLVAAAWAFITRDMDYEQKDKLIADLYSQDYQEARKEEAKKEEQKTKATKGEVVAAPKEKWRAPKGWKPPGWNEEQSYKNAIAFMSDKPG